MELGNWHIHKRKVTAETVGGLEPYPAKNRTKRFVDYLMYVVGFVQPLGLLPQLYRIYILHTALGVSVLTWALFAFFNVLWAVYGIVHREKPLIIAYILIAILDAAIAVGAAVIH